MDITYFWIQKLMKWCNFWIQKLLKWSPNPLWNIAKLEIKLGMS